MDTEKQDECIINVEKTLALIKPDATSKASEIIEDIKNNGFSILQQRRIRLSPEQAADFYAEHYGKMFFPSLIAFMTSDDIIAFVLSKKDAISEWRTLIGPTDPRRAQEKEPNTLRAIYGHDNTKNALHGSDNLISAHREIKFMFPDTAAITEPLVKPAEMKEYLSKHINPTLIKGLTELCKQKPEDPIVWLAHWILYNNPNKPKSQLN